ncbi:MAG: HsdM family class I SAM-dependent methyltransferase [Phycisphaerae bacterium]
MKRAIHRGLERCGYNAQRLVVDYRFDGLVMPFAGFAYAPWDARSACITVVDSDIATIKSDRVRRVGAPVVLQCHGEGLVWYKQTSGGIEQLREIGSDEVEFFFQKHEHDFSPRAIYAAKTRVGVPGEGQLTFVDIGLMPTLERDSGDHIARLVARAIDVLKDDLKRRGVHNPVARDMFKSVFWLLAAKILRDKHVEHFATLRPDDAVGIFLKVGRHYSESDLRPPGGTKWASAIQAAADEIFQSSDLGNVTPEALANVYENALVPKNLRKELGIHSTPPYLVDYILGRLRPWIEEIPERDRYVFEPACGSGAFLVGAMRLLRELCTDKTGENRHKYLKERLTGVELDPFALEVARLSLTLADIPHSNGWKLEQGDIFESNMLEAHAAKARIVLANPPYEKFGKKVGKNHTEHGASASTGTKAMAMLGRIVPNLQEGAVLGVVLPVGSLHSKEGRQTRKFLMEDFEILEVCLLPDGVFAHSHHEIVMLMCRRLSDTHAPQTHILYNRIAPADVPEFRRTHYVRTSEKVQQSILGQAPDYSLQWRELESVWRYCSNYPRFVSMASVGQGFSFVRRDKRPPDAVVQCGESRRGHVKAFLGNMAKTMIFSTPEEALCRLDSDVIRIPRLGAEVGKSQIVVNQGRVTAPWLIRAVLDPEGHAVNNNFLVVRPRSELPLEYFWAILNSPFANAFAYTSRTARHVLAGTIEKMPIPSASRRGIDAVVQAAKEYLAVAKPAGGPTWGEQNEMAVKNALLRMDAEVLRLYDLPPRLERQVLDIFSGRKRLGVGCKFEGYFPPNFNAWIPLHEYISDEYRAATSEDTINRCEPIKSQNILAAVKETAHLFNED